jgi:hypothetical protein
MLLAVTSRKAAKADEWEGEENLTIFPANAGGTLSVNSVGDISSSRVLCPCGL